MTPRTKTSTLVSAMRELARTVQCDDGVANAAIAEAAERLAELDGERTVLRGLLAECASVISTIEVDNSDECDLIADLLGRVNAAYEQTRAGIGTMADLIQYACHCDSEYGYEPDTCVLDEGRHQNCIHAMKLVSEGKKRDDCKYWLPISIVR